MAPTTVPCQYKVGKVLGQGTYAVRFGVTPLETAKNRSQVVKEAVSIKDGKYYACKVISKQLMHGREAMVRNEIAILKRVSNGNKNLLSLLDYFETVNNLYLVTDLCTGGELFDRICAKGSYFEKDARHLVKVVVSAVIYLHSQGIVHRDLKPENLLFRSKDEDSDLLIADFGLSKMVDEQKMSVLTTTCGTPGYMAPEIFRKIGHGKPVDIWAIGVITYFLLCGYTPFDRDQQADEIKAICNADYSFEPEEYWEHITDTARDFIQHCLTVDQKQRPSAEQLLQHEWLKSDEAPGLKDPEARDGSFRNLLPQVQRGFNAKNTWRSAFAKVKAANTFKALDPETRQIRAEVDAAQASARTEQIPHGQDVQIHENLSQMSLDE